MFGMLNSLWDYRGFILSSIRNEFVARFARSRLGGLWMIIHPLAQVAIYALVLSNVLQAKLPGIDHSYAYALYLMAGMAAWNLFADIIGRFLTLFIEQGNLMKKIRFPRITLPAVVLGSALLNNLLLILSLLVVFALMGQKITLEVLWLLPLILVTAALASGIGLVLGVLNVFVRDIGQVIPIILQVWFWLTPIIYPVAVIPEKFKGTMAINPMFPIVNAYQEILVYNKSPELLSVAWIAAISIALMAFGLFLFRRAAPEMVDVL
ncbi:ABC transporter permease [Pseudomonas sp. SCB32]|uniref:ABC transporter permease n=1 Tax=Pseudomonas sp. SCB32 TaxID=2653853 RepID=UPI00126574D2|nr:ABC transporter permease [Pseudomonas sp. SCB32]